jgi:hypothetical protein
MYIELAKTGHLSIKQIPDLSASVIGLEKYNRSKIPGTFDIVYPSKGSDDRWMTGIDEESRDLLELINKDEKEGKSKQKEILKLRLELQARLGVRDLSAISDYWKDYRIRLDQLKEMDLSNPKHQLAIRVLVANRCLMPDLGYRNKPQYLRTKFYLHNEISENDRKVTSTADKDKAFAELYNLFKTENPKLHLIAKLLFRGRQLDGMPFSTLYTNFKVWLATETKQENSILFNDLIDMPVDLLTVRNTILTASERGLIVTKSKKLHFREHMLGRSMDEVYRNMLKDEMSVVYQMILEAIDNK